MGGRVRRVLCMAWVLVACSGADTQDTDPEFPPGCIFDTSADTFTFLTPITVGSDASLLVPLEARCPEPLGLTFVWEEPVTGDFSYAGGDTRTLQPYAPEDLEIIFSPSVVGPVQDKLIVRTDNPAAGGVILTLRGEGQ